MTCDVMKCQEENLETHEMKGDRQEGGVREGDRTLKRETGEETCQLWMYD